MPNHLYIIEPADELVAVRDAARLIGRSPTWIRDRLRVGMLSPFTDPSGNAAVSIREVTALRRARSPHHAPITVKHLRLVVDNT